LHKYPIETVIEKVAAAGFQAVELNAEALPWAKPHATPELPANARKHIRKKIHDMNLMVSSVSAHINLIDADREKRKDNLAYALGCIELAGDLGTSVAHLLSGEVSANISRQEALGWLVEAVAKCIEKGASLGVNVAFEPVATHLICDSAGLDTLIHALKPLTLYVNFDPSHLWVHGDDVPKAIRSFKNRINHVHVKDATGTPDNYQFPPLGKGEGDFQGFIAALHEIAYDGVLSVEYEANAFGYEESEVEIVEGSLQFVRQLIL
jgi:sugar phosphate isomerase/epimerase